jgi:hypothetical protein
MVHCSLVEWLGTHGFVGPESKQSTCSSFAIGIGEDLRQSGNDPGRIAGFMRQLRRVTDDAWLSLSADDIRFRQS